MSNRAALVHNSDRGPELAWRKRLNGDAIDTRHTFQIGAQRIISEEPLPVSWSKLIDESGGVLSDTLQDINEIGERIDTVKSTGGEQALHEADEPGADFGPTKQPRPSSHGNYPQCAL